MLGSRLVAATPRYEEENQISNPAYAGTIEALKSEAEAHKGTAITTLAIPEATLNIPYSFSLSAWGGGGGYVWSLSSGSLPAGLTLSSDGVISGTPNVRRTTTIGIRVDGTAVARQAARVQRYKKNYVFKVK